MIPYRVTNWHEVKRAIEEGHPARVFEHGEFWDLWVDFRDGGGLACDLMKVAFIDGYPEDVTKYFSRGCSLEFETKYLNRLREQEQQRIGESQHA